MKKKAQTRRSSLRAPNKESQQIRPAHLSMGLFDQEISKHIWSDKYRYGDEDTPFESFARVVQGVYAKDRASYAYSDEALQAMRCGLWMPAGRIHAGAGTPKLVTLINCYVCRTIDDSMVGIADALKDAMLTMQQGGGIGMDFSTLRPSGAWLHRTGSEASGPLPFMDMWNSMCGTIMSAGSRRGAMMGTMRDDHPDLLKFIEAKHRPGRLTNFNISILVSDAFMAAVEEGEKWYLGFTQPPASGNYLWEEDGWYAYTEHDARELWDIILKSTYEYSEPGVIFIDRINSLNNLNYCETIHCTNPCGEQPLPPNGACNLGAVNLARMVRDPFTPQASLDLELLRTATRIGVRFLDNVIDVTNYPLKAQAQEEESKRRIGLGITGLGNALAMMGLEYGSARAVSMSGSLMEVVANESYLASALLAQERGPFPAWDPEKWAPPGSVFHRLKPEVQEAVRKHGIRNGVLNTIAPTGTTSIYYGNVSSGIEPTFAHSMRRKVLQPDDSFKEYIAYDYAYALFRKLEGESAKLPKSMVTTQDLDVQAHVSTQAACQQWVDASISKTINCPETMSYEAFKDVYWGAYSGGCKGCTTYRPSEVRGSILEDASNGRKEKSEEHIAGQEFVAERPLDLMGITRKVVWPTVDQAFYVTVNFKEDGKPEPFEVFISSKSAKYAEWTTALTLMITALLRKGGNINFIPKELQEVVSATDTAWIGGKFHGSLVAYLGYVLEDVLQKVSQIPEDVSTGTLNPIPTLEEAADPDPDLAMDPHAIKGAPCKKCGAPAVVRMEGCATCMNCGDSTCG